MPHRLPAVNCILVATDFSDSAAVALEWALALARAHRARVHFVHALVGSHLPKGLSDEPGEALAGDVMHALRSLEDRARRVGVEASSEWAKGEAWRVVLDAQIHGGADLVVVGARGHTAFARLLLGSTADRVIRTCPVPVLTVHPEDLAPPAECRAVLVATDFSEQATLATAAAVRLLRLPERDGRLVLLHVCHLPLVYESEAVAAAVARQVAEDETRARRQVETAAASLRTGGLTVDVEVRQGFPVHAIIDTARDVGADLIAVGTRGHSGLSHFFMGSVAERVVHHAPCPVMTVRHPAAG